jgi:hypothetical protein
MNKARYFSSLSLFLLWWIVGLIEIAPIMQRANPDARIGQC